MATLTGNDGSVKVGSTSVAAVRNFSVEITADTIETSVMGQEVRTYVKGMSSFSGSADIYFDPSEFDDAESTFNPTSGNVGADPIAVVLYVKTDASNDIAFTGNVVVTGYTVNSSMDGMVEASISFQGSGGTTFSASGNV
jgi:predicted secreted protein